MASMPRKFVSEIFFRFKTPYFNLVEGSADRTVNDGTYLNLRLNSYDSSVCKGGATEIQNFAIRDSNWVNVPSGLG